MGSDQEYRLSFIHEMCVELAALSAPISNSVVPLLLSMAALETAPNNSGVERPHTPKLAMGFFDWDVPNDRLYSDATLAEYFGLPESECARGLPVAAYLPSVHPNDRPMVEQKIREALEKKCAYSVTYRLRGADNETRWVLARGQVSADEKGNPLRFPGAIIDIGGDVKRAA